MTGSKNISNTALKLSYGMVGGGQGAFIGDVHRKTARFDEKADIVAGCFSRDFHNTLETGAMLGIDAHRLYKTFEEMAEAERSREDGIDFVVIVTPNHLHYPVAKAFLEQGIHVVCDKPLTVEVEQAEELASLAKDRDLLFCVTYTYTGYPMVKHAREMIARGDIGDIRFINAEYSSDWLATLVEQLGENKQAAWRTDPAQTGKSNCIGDIGTHAEHLVSYLTGLTIKTLCARLDTLVEGRVLDDNATVMVDYEHGAKAVYWISQIAIGHDNDLRVRIYGTKGSIAWAEENPNYLTVSYLDRPTEILSRGRDPLHPLAESYCRNHAGLPEGYVEAFANIYSTFMTALNKKKSGESFLESDWDFPSIEEGVQGVKFIDRCVESSQRGAVWIDF